MRYETCEGPRVGTRESAKLVGGRDRNRAKAKSRDQKIQVDLPGILGDGTRVIYSEVGIGDEIEQRTIIHIIKQTGRLCVVVFVLCFLVFALGV